MKTRNILTIVILAVILVASCKKNTVGTNSANSTTTASSMNGQWTVIKRTSATLYQEKTTVRGKKAVVVPLNEKNNQK